MKIQDKGPSSLYLILYLTEIGTDFIYRALLDLLLSSLPGKYKVNQQAILFFNH